MKDSIKTKAMKTIYLITGIIVITVISFLVVANSKLSASNDNSKIIFEELIHDFGTVDQGTLLEYSYKFTNQGDLPLIIENIQASCGCTGTATDGKTEYFKGESGEIKITFNTQGREGHIVKNIMVSTNDTVNSMIVLEFKCDITKPN